MKQETLTLVLVNFAGIMQRADESLLPGVYKEVGAALHTDPTGLGSLTLFRSVVQSSCYPLAAYLAVHHNRAHVIALGAFLWATATFLVAISSTFLQLATTKLLNITEALFHNRLQGKFAVTCPKIPAAVWSIIGLHGHVPFFLIVLAKKGKGDIGWSLFGNKIEDLALIKTSKMKQETLTLVLVNFAGIMQRADESLLPGVYKEVGAALHTDPTGLGSLTLFRSVVQSSCYPLAAYLAVHHNRAHVIALGAFLWAAATFLVAISSTFLQVAISRGLNGIGLAIVMPAILSLVADSTDEGNRGMAFGWLQLTGNLGSIIGNLCSVLLATTSFMGIAGWRVSFHLVGIISVIVGVLVYLFAKDPHFSDADGRAKEKTPQTFVSEFKDLIKDAKSVVKIPTFQILVAQGVSGTFPWSGLSFAPMWLELIGFSHKQTASLLNIFVIGGSFGSLFGGRMGDILAKRLPNSGRIMLSQISAGSSIPLAGILLLVLPYDPSTAFMHGLVFFTMGLCTSWNAPATNNPIFAEIVPERSRTTIYALDNSFESVLSSFAPPIVGILAQRLYGYKVPKTSSDSVKVETDRENAESLAKALFMSFAIPMSICVFIYSFLYWSYPRDRERAKMNALIESEMQQVEAQDSPFGEEYSQLHLSESKGLDGKETTETDVENGKNDKLDFDDDSDDKALLSSKLTSSD